ncbi:MAG: hypothetical protein MUO82_04085 [Candidatus Thermoplasmatota archaeon]|nr:hypothetical protein [Candidatus Thermoplasmatota archaeon]
MGLDEEIVLFDEFGSWYLTLKLDSNVSKIIIVNQIIKALREHITQSWIKDMDYVRGPHWNKSDILVQ